MPNTLKFHRVIKAPAERVFRAFTDPEAMPKWLPPHGFIAKVHHMDAKQGGHFKMSFTNFTTGDSHSFGGAYLEFVPAKRLVYTDKFDDPNLPGEMKVTVEFREVTLGPPEHGTLLTELSIEQANVPDAIPPEMCYLGWQESLTLLAQLVEAEVCG